MNDEITSKIDTKYDNLRSSLEKLSDKVTVLDKDDYLDLFCYIHNDNSEIVSKCRGLIFHKNKLIINSTYTKEYVLFKGEEGENHECEEQIKSDIGDLKNYNIYDSYEGCLLRVFYFSEEGKEKWYISTHRKLDAYKSRWASKYTYGEIFEYVLKILYKIDIQTFFNSLDKNKQYIFLLLNNEDNRVVSCLDDNIYHIGTISNYIVNYSEDLVLNGIIVPKPKQHQFDTYEQIFEYINDIDIKKLQGLVFLNKDGNSKNYKILNSKYKKLFDLRGNQPILNFRYVQIRMNKQFVDLMYELYPDNESEFDECENIIYKIACNIYKSYVDRFINHKFSTVSKEEYTITKLCHGWHLKDKTKNRVTKDKVIQFLNESNPIYLYNLIKLYRNKNENKDNN